MKQKQTMAEKLLQLGLSKEEVDKLVDSKLSYATINRLFALGYDIDDIIRLSNR